MRVLIPVAAILSVVQALSAPGLAARDPHVQETCGSLVNAALSYLEPFQRLPITVGVLNACLCESDVPRFVDTNSVTQIGVGYFGRTRTINEVIQLLRNRGRTCNFPEQFSVRQCLAGDPCNFICTNGFVRNGNNCHCPHPKQECNGFCTDSPHCPSSQKRNSETQWQKRTTCDAGFTACGTTSSQRKLLGAYECVDTRSDLESCGGCSIPLHDMSPRGEDCSSIPGVADVSCQNGACVVYECMPGYTISHDHSICHSKGQLNLIKELIANPYKMAVDLIV